MAYLFFGLLTILTSVYIYKKVPVDDNKFLVYIFIISMSLRCFLAVLLTHIAYINNHDGFISGDDRLYSLSALDILRNISEGTYVYRILHFGINLYTHILAIFYAVFGFKLIASRFINCYIGSIIPIMAYFTTRRFVNDRYMAKIVSIICAFYPSFIFWSTHNLKEPLIILSVCIGVYILIKTVSFDLTIRDIIILLLFSFTILNLQVMYGYQIVFIVLAIFFCYCTKPVKIIGITFLAVLLLFIFWKENFLTRFIIFAEEHNWQMAVADKAGYYIYPPDFVKNMKEGYFSFLSLCPIYLKGMIYFLFSPFPWSMESLHQLFALPQVMLWYILSIFFISGFIKFLKNRPNQAISVFIFLFIGASLWAFTEGNAGAAFRHRDHFAIIVFIFAAGGIKYFLDYLKQLKEKS